MQAAPTACPDGGPTTMRGTQPGPPAADPSGWAPPMPQLVGGAR